jgi:hypothetical protein
MFIPREILLVEIDRRCFFADCNARSLIGLTRQEASDYRGFECAVCKRWNDDHLSDKDVPDEWNAVIRPIN